LAANAGSEDRADGAGADCACGTRWRTAGAWPSTSSRKTQGGRPVPGAESNTPAAGAVAAPTSGPAATTAVAASREDAYRQLKAAADLLQHLEPHSPVPYLVHKAVQLGGAAVPAA